MEVDNLFFLQGSFGSLGSLIAGGGAIAISVLLVLVGFSIFSWMIIIKKFQFFRSVRRESEQFYREFRQNDSLSAIYQDCDRFPLSPLAGIFKSGFEELNHQVEVAAEGERGMVRSLNALERSLRRASVAEMTTLERSLNWLATTASVAPFVGLFGTVVGIIDAFQGLGAGGATTIQAVAPGISQALVATAAGLFAAIPALIAYNYFIGVLKVMGAEMDDFSAELINLVERSFG